MLCIVVLAAPITARALSELKRVLEQRGARLRRSISWSPVDTSIGYDVLHTPMSAPETRWRARLCLLAPDCFMGLITMLASAGTLISRMPC